MDALIFRAVSRGPVASSGNMRDNSHAAFEGSSRRPVPALSENQ
jgi:hypothetical protein